MKEKKQRESETLQRRNMLQSTLFQWVSCEFGSVFALIEARQSSAFIWLPRTHRWSGMSHRLGHRHSWIWMSWSLLKRCDSCSRRDTDFPSVSSFSISLQGSVILSGVFHFLKCNPTWRAGRRCLCSSPQMFYYYSGMVCLWIYCTWICKNLQPASHNSLHVPFVENTLKMFSSAS